MVCACWNFQKHPYHSIKPSPFPWGFGRYIDLICFDSTQKPHNVWPQVFLRGSTYRSPYTGTDRILRKFCLVSINLLIVTGMNWLPAKATCKLSKSIRVSMFANAFQMILLEYAWKTTSDSLCVRNKLCWV